LIRRKLAALLVCLVSIGVVMGQIGPALDVVKSVDNGTVYPGGEVNFTIFVNNTGDDTLYGVNLSDDMLAGSVNLPDLEPGANCTYRFTSVVEYDIVNNVTVEAVNATGYSVSDEDSAAVDVIHPNLSLNKFCEPAVIYEGENVTYTLTLENTGDVDITAINLTDSLRGLMDGPLDLSPGENRTWSYNETVWMDASNNASVAGLDPLGALVLENASASVDVIHPNLTVTKMGEPNMVYSGDNVTYTIVVENGGDVNLTDIWVTDLGSGWLRGPFDLVPGENQTWMLESVANVSAYDDLYNLVNASGMDTTGRWVEGNATAHIDVIYPELSLCKSVTPEVAEPGEEVTYRFVLENTGDVNLTSANVTDPDLNWTAGPFNITPGNSVTLELNAIAYVSGTNNATAVGLDPLGNTVVAWDTASVSVLATGDIRSIGFWKHQFSDRGRKHIDHEALELFLDLIIDESSLFEELYNLSYENATSYLWVSRGSMLNRSIQQCLACWLNWANGAVGFIDMVDTDFDGQPDTQFGEAMNTVEDLIANGEDKGDFERAKDICDSINNSGQEQEEEQEEEQHRGPPEDKTPPVRRGPPEDKTPPVRRGPPEDKTPPVRRGPPQDKGKVPKKK